MLSFGPGERTIGRSGARMEPAVDLGDLLIRVALAVAAYLAGSIPVGVLVARAAGGPDPRTVGSGRTGGTNALRALGRKWAAVVVLGDLAKGALPVLAARVVTGEPAIEAICGLAALVGSTRSVFLGFGGGRGVGTGVGTLLVIQPLAVVLAAPVFVGVVLWSGFVSLGSLLGSLALVPAMLAIWIVGGGAMPFLFVVYTAAGVGIIWIAHADNIHRLLHGTERRFDLDLLGGRRSH